MFRKIFRQRLLRLNKKFYDISSLSSSDARPKFAKRIAIGEAPILDKEHPEKMLKMKDSAIHSPPIAAPALSSSMVEARRRLKAANKTLNTEK